MTVVGGINAALGGLGYVMGQGRLGCERPCPSSTAQRWGIGMMIGGGAVMLAGIPVLVIGARRIERHQGEGARALPVVAISPRGAVFGWSF